MAFIQCKSSQSWLATIFEDNLMNSRHTFKVRVKDNQSDAGIYKYIRIV